MADLSLFWLLSFDDILAITETVAGNEHGSCRFLLDLEDLSASNFRKLFSNGLVRELHVGKHQVGDLAQDPSCHRRNENHLFQRTRTILPQFRSG
jgi:hypothetical protein